MSGFFSIDGKFYRFGSMLCDLILIGLIWTIFSLPLITMGATTTALYYVCTKKNSGQDVYIFKSFWQSFKENFVKATMTSLILGGLALIIWMNLHILGQIDIGILNIPVTIALWFVLFQIILIATNAFCILARFETSISLALRYGLFIGYRNFFTTITNWATLLAIFLASFYVPILLFFMGGLYVYFTSFAFIKVFRKHSAEFDGHVEKAKMISDED